MAFSLFYKQTHYYSDDLLAYTGNDSLLVFCRAWLQGQKHFEFFSSGSTGKPKPILLSRENMAWSAQASAEAFQLRRDAHLLLALQPQVIGGAMVLVRAMEWQTTCTVVDASANPMLHLDAEHDCTFLSLVPYQLESILSDAASRAKLNRFELLLLGGAPISESLRKKAIERLDIRLLQSYGMTETSSHIALRDLRKEGSVYHPLSGVKLSLSERGTLVIDSRSAIKRPLETNDLAEMTNGGFRILGRADLVVNSGGIKISIEEAEDQIKDYLLSQGIAKELACWKKPDAQLGETLVLMLESDPFDTDQLLRDLKSHLPKYKAPKAIIFAPSLLRSDSGKVLREASWLKYGQE